MKKKSPNRRVRVRLENSVQSSTQTLPNQGRGDIVSDVLGSYTGTAEHDEKPEQDPDDL